MNQKPLNKKTDKPAGRGVRDAQDIGKLLESARTGKGLTIDAVNKKTHIHTRVLKNLEAGIPDEALSEIYTKGFLKKYATFLGLSGNEAVKEYLERLLPKDASKDTSGQKLFIEARDESELDMEKYIPLLVVGVGVILVSAVAVFGIVKLRHFIAAHPFKVTGTVPAQRAALPAAVSRQAKNTEQAQSPSRSRQKTGPVTVSILTNDDVWLSLERDGSIVFKGVLHRGASESWTCEKQIKLRAGKLEVLEFTINGKYLGKIGKGVEDVVIDARGARISSAKRSK
ncbi:MAG: DUF4115 domain-containing protein [Candidatus Omnitrophica bacterium]|nr:DUF4115 domain-containing protein [Candidatus Omnitrophota bacterium]